ncbi:MAG: ribose 5-phosphate isomerase B [Candidatus Sericytochromatia bacterium]|nr:ribose 5-phosphate isomerase B [Candidatus Sericytochromatia bacterium]
MRIAIGSDHGGFPLKEALRAYVQSLGHTVTDVGTYSTVACDYPDYALKVAGAVATGETDRGIMIDGAGIGSSMVANKLPGIRAALCNDMYAARNAREHNDANVLTLGARVIGPGLAEEVVRLFLDTPFASRHQPRIDKIHALERELHRNG